MIISQSTASCRTTSSARLPFAPAKHSMCSCRLGSLQPEIALEPALYLATPTAMIGIIRETARSVRHLMIIGHNPGLHALALDLTGSGLRRDITSMAVKFPSGALAVLTFEENDWTEIRPAAGRLVQFVATRSVA